MREIVSLDELKIIELEIMKQIHDFCVDNKITYYLAYGTLLGAVRHNGFIPWDDDIDIWMFREDYERFKKNFPDYGKNRDLYIATYDTKVKLHRNMMKVCDARTTLVESEYGYSDAIGVFVDIWPLDGSPNNILLNKLNGICMNCLNVLFSASIENNPNSALRKVLSKIGRIINPLNILKLQRWNALKHKCVESEVLECYAEKSRHYSKKSFEEQKLVKFEDAEFFIPVGYDSLLCKRYGNYMQLPPENQQEPHHIANVFWND